MSWTYNAELIRVIDGDTVVLRLWRDYALDLDFGFYIKEQIVSRKSTEMSFRLSGINCPEITGVSVEERAKGLAAKAALEKMLLSGTIGATTYKPDKYGRWLVTLQVTQPDGTVLNVNDALIAGGYAVPYMT